MSSSGTSPWLYKAAAIASTVALAGGAGYVIYKYVLAPEPEAQPETEPVSMQELLTGGATRSAPRGRGAGVPVRKTPSPAKSRAGPSLPSRKSPGSATAKATAAPAATAAASADIPADAAAASATDPAAASSPSSSAAASGSAPAPKPAAAGLKACACCAQPLKSGGLPQRCGQCKAVYYCSVACQKKHWPEHKPNCAKAGAKLDGAPATSSSGGGATTAAAAAAAAATENPAPSSPPAQTPSAAPEGNGASDAAAEAGESSTAVSSEGPSGGAAAEADGGASTAPAAPAARDEADANASGSGGGSAANPAGGLQGALVEVLRQAAEKGAGTLDGAFEEAVMHFLGGKLQTALEAFKSLQASARASKRSDLVMELHKWLGHTHTKLGNFNAAADAFQAGIDDAKAAGNTAAHVDNAVGLGNLWKVAGQLTQAAEVLKQALTVAQAADSAGMQSEVLVALGNVVMAADPEEGLACLQIAVKLREDEVAKAAEAGDRAAMATGMMQAAAAMVNMAAALFATRRFEQSKQAYEQAMEIFELMEDHDKVIQVLINLANLAELQLDQPGEALEYRHKLAAALKEAGHPGIAGGASTTPCAVCKESVSIFKQRARSDTRGPMVLLGCLHAHHDSCFKEWCDTTNDGVAAAAAAAVAKGGEEAAVVAAAAASPGAKRTTVCPTCKSPVPVMS